jgi:hypothetical protein
MSKVCPCRGEKGGVCGERHTDRDDDEDIPLLEDGKVKGQDSEASRSKDTSQLTPSDSKDTKS